MDKKTLILTGATSDTGKCILNRIAANYHKIWAHYSSSEESVCELQEAYGDVITPIKANFLDIGETENMIDTIKNSGCDVDHIIHLSAQKAFNKQAYKCNWEEYQRGIDISLRSIVMILNAFLPQMEDQGYGRVIFMLSSYVTGVPPKYQSPYITVKYALLGLMREFAAEYAGKGITVNAISPDMMETKFLSGIPKLILQQNAKNNPLKRNILVEEVAPAFEYLLSDSTGAITGQNILITGGVR